MKYDKLQKTKAETAGFTLVEIVAVLVLLGILAAVAVPKFFDLQPSAEEKAAKTAVAEVQARIYARYSKLIYAGSSCSNAIKEVEELKNLADKEDSNGYLFGSFYISTEDGKAIASDSEGTLVHVRRNGGSITFPRGSDTGRDWKLFVPSCTDINLDDSSSVVPVDPDKIQKEEKTDDTSGDNGTCKDPTKEDKEQQDKINDAISDRNPGTFGTDEPYTNVRYMAGSLFIENNKYYIVGMNNSFGGVCSRRYGNYTDSVYQSISEIISKTGNTNIWNAKFIEVFPEKFVRFEPGRGWDNKIEKGSVYLGSNGKLWVWTADSPQEIKYPPADTDSGTRDSWVEIISKKIDDFDGARTELPSGCNYTIKVSEDRCETSDPRGDVVCYK